MPDIKIVAYRGKWYAAFSGTNGTKRLSLDVGDATAANRPAAERACLDLARALAAPASDLIGDIVKAYMADSDAITQPNMKWLWKPLESTFGNLRPDQITRDICRGYAAKRGKSPGTIRKELGFLASALNWNKTPAAIERPAEPEPRDRPLSRAELEALLAAAKSQPHLEAFVRIAFATAARKEAILQLTWLQVDFARKQINFGKKEGGKRRAIVPMTTTLLTYLQERRLAAPATSSHVIEYDGSPVGDIKKAFQAAVKRAGLNDITPHDLRHTAAVFMLENGSKITEVAQYLGHSNVAITYKVYARYRPDHLREAASALEL